MDTTDLLHALGENEAAKESLNMAIELGEEEAGKKDKPFAYRDRLEKAKEEYK